MRNVFLAVLLLGLSGLSPSDPGTPLPTAKFLSPLGTQAEVGCFPSNLALSADGKWLAVSASGNRQMLSVINVGTGKVTSSLSLPGQALYYGLQFARGGPPYTLYASQGGQNRVCIYLVDAAGQLHDSEQFLRDKDGSFFAGLALSADGSHLYVAGNETTAASAHQGRIDIFDVASKRLLGHCAVAGFPLALAVGPNHRLYVSSERDGVVSVVDTSNPSSPQTLSAIGVGSHPMTLLVDGNHLYVANASSDTVSVVDCSRGQVLRTVLLRPSAMRGLPGATPSGLALRQGRLYVTLADLNAVAVLEAADGRVLGYLPCGWYPTAVAVSGSTLLVANAKGVAPRHPNGANRKYILELMEGTLSCFRVPADAELPSLSAHVLRNNRLGAATAVPLLPPIKHVIYIIKENRAYDQVMGDDQRGNGDPSLVLFGRNVTPNQHALAERFVLLDNFYCCAEVSGDGWNWSTAGMASEYVERNVPFSYSRKGRSYDYEGENNGESVELLGLPDVARPPAGYLWDQCARHRVPYRVYGVFTSYVDKGGAQDNQPSVHSLVGHTDTDFRRFDLRYADSDAWVRLGLDSPLPAYGDHHASSRFAEWKWEFDQCVRSGDMPALQILRLPRDHTAGTKPDLPSPRAMVADNDFGVGQIVEAVSHSRFWKDTAIVVLEDDAQSGRDHVDAHRSVCFVISPWVRRGLVDHHFYNTDSVLRTIEGLLGMPPLCQYDATAPTLDVFGDSPQNADPYDAVLPQRSVLAEMNTMLSYRAQDSARLDFSEADRVPDEVLNDILWHSSRPTE